MILRPIAGQYQVGLLLFRLRLKQLRTGPHRLPRDACLFGDLPGATASSEQLFGLAHLIGLRLVSSLNSGRPTSTESPRRHREVVEPAALGRGNVNEFSLNVALITIRLFRLQPASMQMAAMPRDAMVLMFPRMSMVSPIPTCSSAAGRIERMLQAAIR